MVVLGCWPQKTVVVAVGTKTMSTGIHMTTLVQRCALHEDACIILFVVDSHKSCYNNDFVHAQNLRSEPAHHTSSAGALRTYAGKEIRLLQ